MNSSQILRRGVAAALAIGFAGAASAQSFQVQCPETTPNPSQPIVANGVTIPAGTTKCQQISGGDGFATMGDGTQTYLFAFGPLSGLANIVQGQPGTMTRDEFMVDNTEHLADVAIGAPTTDATFNGAVGLTSDQISEQIATLTIGVDGLDNPLPGTGYHVNDAIVFAGGNPSLPATARVASVDGTGAITSIQITYPGSGYLSTPTATASGASGGSGASIAVAMTTSGEVNGHIDPRLVMDVGTLNGSQPAPMMAINEDDEFFLTLTNVGQVMRPDLFEQHTVHFHGYANASAFFDGVPDASVAINIGSSFTYYYMSPDAGTYFWHCHITPPEHLQMGMVGQIFVRPRQNRVSPVTPLYNALVAQQSDKRTKCDTSDLLCSNPLPPANTVKRSDGFVSALPSKSAQMYAYNDGDGSTRYDVEYPIQFHGFDPNFHFVGMTFNPENFTDMKDKYFLINGRSYPDTVGGYACKAGDSWPACGGKAVGDVVPGPMSTQSPDGMERTSQPLPTVINIPKGGRALLRLSELNITEMHTVATLGIPMTVVGWNARLLRDQDGGNMSYQANSITLGGGESADVILDATDPSYQAGQKFYFYTPNLDHLSNDAENFGGMMTEINICDSVDPTTKLCTVNAPNLVAGNL